MCSGIPGRLTAASQTCTQRSCPTLPPRHLVFPLPQRDCRERLAEHKGLCPEERAFMFEWNLFLHRQPLHADGDLPASLAAFAAAHRRSLARDGPFRRCMVAHLLNLWRFRLLTPSQLHQLTRELPRVAPLR